MSGYEFTPFGIVPLGTPVERMAEGAIAGATVNVEPPPPAPVRPSAQLAALPAPGAKTIHLRHPDFKPSDVVKMARAELRDIEREIRRLEKLKIKRDELKRLLDAAAHKPARNLRSLPTRSA